MNFGNANSPPKLGGVDASSRKRCGATLLRADGVVPHIHKVASHLSEPPRLRAILGNLDARSHPSLKGGEYAARETLAKKSKVTELLYRRHKKEHFPFCVPFLKKRRAHTLALALHQRKDVSQITIAGVLSARSKRADTGRNPVLLRLLSCRSH